MRKPPTPEQIRAQQKADAERGHAQIKANLPAKTVAAAATVPATARAPAYETSDAYLNSGGMSIGRIIRFDGKNGRFVFKDDDSEVSSDTDFVMLGDGSWVGWIKFHEEGAPEHVGGLIFAARPAKAGVGRAWRQRSDAVASQQIRRPTRGPR
jgi:hypothetical protein